MAANNDVPTFRVLDYDITFPWYAYPQFPFSGYYEEEFFSELDRLLRYIIEIKHEKKKLVHFTIGASGEEIQYGSESYFDNYLQYRQLIPIQLQRAAEKGVSVINIVIAPNDIDVPLFTREESFKDSGLKFEKRHENYWVCTSLDISILIFKTMMPTKDQNRNALLIKHLKDINYDFQSSTKSCYYKQTRQDLEFVNYFYKVFEETCRTLIDNGSLVTCFNFAVFNSEGRFSSHNKFAMFKELVSVFDGIKNYSEGFLTSLLFEWVFQRGSYSVYETKIGNENREMFRITYADSYPEDVNLPIDTFPWHRYRDVDLDIQEYGDNLIMLTIDKN